MLDRFRSVLLRVLRVPGEPDVPHGSRAVRVFRAAPNYFRYKVVLWVLAQVGGFIGLAIGYAFYLRLASRVGGVVGSALQAAEIAAWAFFILQIPASYALLRLDFEMRWYLISDRSLRIRQGTVSLREKTMTYANVQQIAIRQNPLQRVLGISDVQVRSAGGGGTGPDSGGGKVGESMHECWFRGVDNAEEIRTAIRDRVRRHKDSGLGDPDEPILVEAEPTPGILLAARELRDEVRRLRTALVNEPPKIG